MVHNWPPLAGNNKVRLVQQSIEREVEVSGQVVCGSIVSPPRQSGDKGRSIAWCTRSRLAKAAYQDPNSKRLEYFKSVLGTWDNPTLEAGERGCKSKTSLGYAVRSCLKTTVSASLLCVGVISGSTQSGICFLFPKSETYSTAS